MIEELLDDNLIERFGGRFKLCVLIQRRWVQFLQGARPMVDPTGLTDMEIIVREIVEGKIDLEVVEDVELDDDVARD